MKWFHDSFAARVILVMVSAIVAAHAIHSVLGAQTPDQSTTSPSAGPSTTSASSAIVVPDAETESANVPVAEETEQRLPPPSQVRRASGRGGVDSSAPFMPAADNSLRNRSTGLDQTLIAPTARDMLGYYQGLAQHLSISLTALGLAVAGIGILTWKSYHDLIGNLRKEVDKEKADWEAQKTLIDAEFAAKRNEAVLAIQAATSDMLMKSAKATEVLQELESTRAVVNKMLGEVQAVVACHPQPGSAVAPGAGDSGSRAVEDDAFSDEIEAESAEVSKALQGKLEPDVEQSKGAPHEVTPAAGDSDLEAQTAEAGASPDQVEAESDGVRQSLQGKIEPNGKQGKGPQNEG